MELDGSTPVKRRKIEEHPYVEITKNYNWIVRIPKNINIS